MPARPAAWPSGAIDGVLCRGQIEISRLTWKDRTIHAVIKSAKTQEIALYAPGSIGTLSAKGAVVKLADTNSRRLSLPAGQDVVIDIRLK